MAAHSKRIDDPITARCLLTTAAVTGNGTTLTYDLFSEFMKQNGICYVGTAFFYPAPDSLAEQAAETVKESFGR